MILISVLLLFASQLILIQSDCTEFESEWETCSQDSYPGKTLCRHKVNTSEKVIINENREKVSAIYCYDDAFPGILFECLTLNDSKHLILIDCVFPQILFDKLFTNSQLKELTIRYPNNNHIRHMSLRIHNLPRIQYLSLRNFYTFSYFDLSLSSLPLMRSIKISNSTFSSLPTKPFQEISRLKGLALTVGVLESLPDDFLFGTNLQSLDLSVNVIKKFQPSLLGNAKELKKLNLSHNLLEGIDENLFSGTAELEKLSLDHNRIRFLPSGLFKTLRNISVLSLNHNKLREIPDNIFQGLDQMVVLSLNDNHLSILPPNIFNDLASLKVLNLQSNHLRLLPGGLFATQTRLREIDLSKNKISRFFSSAPFGNNSYLSKVNLSDNQLDKFLDLNWSLYNIDQLDLSGNLIREVAVPIQARPGGYIFLQRNQINTVTVTENPNSAYRYFLEGNPFGCDCNLSDFVNFLPLVADAKELVCGGPWYRSGKYLSEFEDEEKLCEAEDDCPINCACSLLRDERVEVNCRNAGKGSAAIPLPRQTTVLRFENNRIVNLSDVDEYSWVNITRLYLSYNSLTSLKNWTVPPKMQLLAIDGNKLTELPSSVMERVNQSENFQIYLRENDWPCDCRSVPLKTWLADNLPKVKDSDTIYCKRHDSGVFGSLIVDTPLDRFICQNPQLLSQRHNECAATEICTTASIAFCFLLNFANKMYY